MTTSHRRIPLRALRWCLLCVALPCASAGASALVDVRTVDDEMVMACWRDGEVEYRDTGTGPTAFKGLDSAGEVIHKFDPPLDTAAAVNPANYTLTSATDAGYASPSRPSEGWSAR